jgi:hypothetical protein
MFVSESFELRLQPQIRLFRRRRNERRKDYVAYERNKDAYADNHQQSIDVGWPVARRQHRFKEWFL